MARNSNLPRKRYRAIGNKWMFRDAKVIEGFIYDSKEGWVEVRDKEVPGEITLVRAGSIFEIAAPKSREKVWFAEGTVAPIDAPAHFNLDDIFDVNQIMILELHEIHTLEDIATELDAVIPGSEFSNPEMQVKTMPLKELLGKLCNNDEKQVAQWIKQARDELAAAYDHRGDLGQHMINRPSFGEVHHQGDLGQHLMEDKET